MEKRLIATWAAVTLMLAGLLFWAGFHIASILQTQNPSVPYHALVLPVVVWTQVFWLALGIYLAAARKRKPVLTGMLWGFGCEAVAIFALILYAASAHY